MASSDEDGTRGRAALLLDPADNVLVACRTVEAGEAIEVDGGIVQARQRLPVGHKLARRAIAPGEKVLRYGLPIGSATEAIPAGAHVHMHNLKSDYIPTYQLEEAAG